MELGALVTDAERPEREAKEPGGEDCLVASLETTQVYAYVSIDALKKVHAATHPAGRATHTTLRGEP